MNSPLRDDLLDFRVANDEIWTLWLSSQLEVNIYHCSIDASTSDWRKVSLSSDIMPKFSYNALFDGSREEFIDEIFLRGKFSMHSISKALGVSGNLLFYP